MARFLILTQYFPPEVGAAQVRLLEVALALRERGHEVTVVTAVPNYPREQVFAGYEGKVWLREVISGVPVIRTWVYPAHGRNVARRLANYLSFASSALFGCLGSGRHDYIFVECPPLFLAITAYMYSRLSGTPYILNLSDLWTESIRDLGFIRNATILWLSERLERFLYRRASYVNVVTQGLEDSLVKNKGVPPEKILWLPNGVNLSRFRADPPDAELARRLGLDDAPVFSFIGTHAQTQGMDVILDAAQRLGGAARVLLVGDGSEKPHLMQRAGALGLTNVTFLDAQPVDAVPRLLALSRASVITLAPSDVLRTTRPAQMFPAMASGKPIIFSGEGEGAEMVCCAECGIVVPPGDADALAQAMLELAHDPERAQRLGANGRAFVEREFGWNTLVARWLAALLGDSQETSPRDLARPAAGWSAGRPTGAG